MCTNVQMPEQTRPRNTLACCLDVRQETNNLNCPVVVRTMEVSSEVNLLVNFDCDLVRFQFSCLCPCFSLFNMVTTFVSLHPSLPLQFCSYPSLSLFSSCFFFLHHAPTLPLTLPSLFFSVLSIFLMLGLHDEQLVEQPPKIA